MVAIGVIEDRPTLTSGRIIGIDLARAVAMFGMVIAHYVWPDGSGSWIDLLASAVKGRAMPLFVMLGGLGVTILTSRSNTPDRALLIRAAILFPLGIALQEATTFIAIILQSYALFFVVAVAARRLPTHGLLIATGLVALVGSWTYQTVAFTRDGWSEPSQLITDPEVVPWSLLLNGSYPYFPVGSFFLLGMALGRLDLRSSAVAAQLAIGGATVGFGTLAFSAAAIAGFDVDRSVFDLRSDEFSLGRLLDTEGHSEMLAWVVSAAGTSVAILGAALWLAPRLGKLPVPLVALGQLALSFYVFQAVLVRVTPHPRDTEIGQELLTAMVIYFVFVAFAVGWRRFFRVGPLEMAFRIGSRSRPARR